MALCVLNLLVEHKVEEHADEGCDSEARLHDEYDGVEEPPQTAVVTSIRKDVVKIRRNESGAIAERETSGQDEAVSSVERHTLRDDGHTGDGDSRKEERGHASKHGGRDGDERCGEFGKDAHNDEEEATRQLLAGRFLRTGIRKYTSSSRRCG